MEVRQSDGTFEDKVFAMYPLIGSRILKPETVDKLNENARKYIDLVLREPWTKLSLRAEMQITLALINNAKNWKNEENNNFWNYITLQFGYRDASGSVVRLLQSSLENAMKRNQRLFLEDANGRAFKTTVVIHALSTKKSWMALFDFLFDFYKSNLNWRVIPNDPLISVMVHALQQKLSGGNEEDVELTISSKAYSFQEGIRKLILYRPVYTRNLFERLIGKIDSLVNSETKKVNTYEELLCEEWFKEKIIAIANTKKSERQTQVTQRDVAIDYSRIRAKFILKNETDVQLKLSEDTEYIILPEDMPIGNYQFEISIQTGGLFKRAKEVVAVGDCIIGDKNLLRFMNRRIVVESITDEFKEEAGHILIRPCYIDQIQYCGMEDTSEGYCPVYSGILYTTGYHGERYEFSYDVHTNKKGITKMLVNPVRIVYISNTALCITDPDGDGLYYYNYYDRSLESVVFALTDHEYTKANKQKYSNADLYSYRTERV